MERKLKLFLCFIFLIGICACSNKNEVKHRDIKDVIKTIENSEVFLYHNVSNSFGLKKDIYKPTCKRYTISIFYDENEKIVTDMIMNEYETNESFYYLTELGEYFVYSNDDSRKPENEDVEYVNGLFKEDGFTMVDLADYCNYVLENDYYDFFSNQSIENKCNSNNKN